MKREKLQEFRQSKNLTQEQMANHLNITVSHYKALEYGQRNPSFELMEKIKKDSAIEENNRKIAFLQSLKNNQKEVSESGTTN